MMRLFLTFLVLIAAPMAAISAQSSPDYAQVQLSNPAQESKAKALMETIRCVVCQGQSIADSDASIAADMRAEIRERIAAGEAPEAIRAWLIGQYGEWVSYKPALEPATYLLWLAPIIALVFGAFLARGRFKRRGR